MNRKHRLSITILLAVTLASRAGGAAPDEPLLRDLPPGLMLKNSMKLPADQTRDAALAVKTSYEPGLLEKPDRVRYRAAGVPSRQVAGWLYGSSGHVWAEYHEKGKGWRQVDATGGGLLPCGIYHIPYFTTEDGEMPILYVSMPKIEAEPLDRGKTKWISRRSGLSC